MFEFSIGSNSFKWNYAHTVNVYDIDGMEIDVFSLNYGRDDYDPAEVMAIALDWIGGY